jgi:hypothetical protein
VHSEGIARRCRTMRTCAAQTLCYSSVAFHADSDGEIPVSEKAFSIAQIRSYPLTGPRTPVDSFDRQQVSPDSDITTKSCSSFKYEPAGHLFPTIYGKHGRISDVLG